MNITCKQLGQQHLWRAGMVLFLEIMLVFAGAGLATAHPQNQQVPGSSTQTGVAPREAQHSSGGCGLHGHVRALDHEGNIGEPVADATIELRNQAGAVVGNVTTTNQNGYYRVDLTPGVYSYKVAAAGYKDEDVKRGIVTKLSAGYAVWDFFLTPGKNDPDKQPPEIVPVPLGQLTGTVLEEKGDGRLIAVPEANIALHNDQGVPPDLSVVARPLDAAGNGAGQYKVLLETGSWRAVVSAAGFDQLVEPNAIEITAGHETRRNFILRKPRLQPAPKAQGIEGRIVLRGPDGSAGLLSKVTAWITPVRATPASTDSPSPNNPLTVDVDGQYRHELAAGVYQVTARLEGYRSARQSRAVYDGKYSRVDLVLVPLPDSEPTTPDLPSIAVHPSPKTTPAAGHPAPESTPSESILTARVSVVRQTADDVTHEQPLPNADVLLRMRGEPLANAKKMTTNDQGIATFSGLERTGDYEAVAHHEGVTGKAEVAVTPAGANETKIVLARPTAPVPEPPGLAFPEPEPAVAPPLPGGQEPATPPERSEPMPDAPLAPGRDPDMSAPDSRPTVDMVALRVKVIDERGQALPTAMVTLGLGDGPAPGQPPRRVGEDGIAEFEVPRNDWHYWTIASVGTAVVEKAVPQQWWRTRRPRGEADVVIQLPDHGRPPEEPTAPGEPEPPAGPLTSLRVQVVGADGQPLPGAVVALNLGAGPARGQQPRQVGRDGIAQFEVPPNDWQYWVRASMARAVRDQEVPRGWWRRRAAEADVVVQLPVGGRMPAQPRPPGAQPRPPGAEPRPPGAEPRPPGGNEAPNPPSPMPRATLKVQVFQDGRPIDGAQVEIRFGDGGRFPVRVVGRAVSGIDPDIRLQPNLDSRNRAHGIAAFRNLERRGYAIHARLGELQAAAGVPPEWNPNQPIPVHFRGSKGPDAKTPPGESPGGSTLIVHVQGRDLNAPISTLHALGGAQVFVRGAGRQWSGRTDGSGQWRVNLPPGRFQIEANYPTAERPAMVETTIGQQGQVNSPPLVIKYRTPR